MLAIGDLAITRGALTYRDGATGAETRIVIDTLTLQARDARSPVNAEFRGTIDGIAVALTGNLGPLATLAQRGLPYPVAVKGEIAGRKSSIALKVQRSDGLVELQDIEASSGASNVKGKLGIRHAGVRSEWTVDLSSQSLALNDIALPIAPATPPGTHPLPTGASHYVFPIRRCRSNRCARTTRAVTSRSAGSCSRTAGRSTTFACRFVLKDGKLDVPHVAGSGIRRHVCGQARDRHDARAGRACGHARAGRPSTRSCGVACRGRCEARRARRQDGDRDRRRDARRFAAQWVSSANGRARAVVGPATVPNTKLDAGVSFDQIVQVVNPFRNASPSTELLCAVVRLPLSGGVARVDRSMRRAKELDVSVSGTLDFRNETLDLSIKPRVRQGIPINIRRSRARALPRSIRVAGRGCGRDGVRGPQSRVSVLAVSTGGLSVLGEALLGRVRLPRQKVEAAAPALLRSARRRLHRAAQPRMRPAAPNPVQDIGSALGRLLGK
jgi:hypothetical protein